MYQPSGQMIHPSTAVAHFHHTMSASPLSYLVNPRRRPDRPPAAHPLPQYLIVITSLSLPIPTALQHQEQKSASRNIRQHFSATCAQRSLRALIIFALTFVPTPMSGLSYVPFAPRHSPVSTTAKDMKGYTVEKRNLSAKANSAPGAAGDADEGLLVQMLWVVISGVRPAECASSHY